MELDLQKFYNINRRVVMWIIFFAILLVLRNFFALVFMAFIFGFLMRKVATKLTARTGMPYWTAVVVPYLCTLAFLVLLLSSAIPRVVDEGAKFSTRVPELFNSLAVEVKNAAIRYQLAPALAKYLDEDQSIAPASAPADGEPVDWEARIDIQELAERLQALSLMLLPGAGAEGGPASVRDAARRYVLGILGGTLNFLLAILVSFLVVLDFDRLREEVRSWRRTTMGRFFHEAAASVIEFAGVVGTAFQCQMAVALLNATITCIGLFLLGIDPLLLLTTIVFLLGLIPVLGVFISSAPIILISFNDYGPSHALLTVGMIVVVHLFEAYIFNPRIYAARFHLNPVLVILILLVAEKLFGAWGMLLGIPVTHYVLNLAQIPSMQRRGVKKATAAPDPLAPHGNADLTPPETH